MSQHTLFPANTGATFSECGLYRYALWRTWDSWKPSVNFLMLNPSTADETDNDPTVERCQRRAQTWGYGRLVVTNLFAYRATVRSEMKAVAEPVGPENDTHIIDEATKADMVVCAWGNDGTHRNRAAEVVDVLTHLNIKLHAFEITSKGQPKHPLYVAYAVKPFLWRG